MLKTPMASWSKMRILRVLDWTGRRGVYIRSMDDYRPPWKRCAGRVLVMAIELERIGGSLPTPGELSCLRDAYLACSVSRACGSSADCVSSDKPHSRHSQNALHGVVMLSVFAPPALLGKPSCVPGCHDVACAGLN